MHRALPPRSFGPGSGANHPKSVPLDPIATRVERQDGVPLLLLDFGGTVMKIRIAPEQLRQDLDALSGSESQQGI